MVVDISYTPIVHTEGNRVFATSKDVAAYFGKRHDNVIRDIEELLFATAKACALNFEAASVTVPMPNGGGRTTKIYQMDRDGFTLLAMGFTGQRALEFKLKYIAAFNEAERRLKMLEAAGPVTAPYAVPQTFAQAPTNRRASKIESCELCTIEPQGVATT